LKLLENLLLGIPVVVITQLIANAVRLFARFKLSKDVQFCATNGKARFSRLRNVYKNPTTNFRCFSGLREGGLGKRCDFTVFCSVQFKSDQIKMLLHRRTQGEVMMRVQFSGASFFFKICVTTKYMYHLASLKLL